MSLLRGMRIYTVHVPTGTPDAQEQAVFVREGFNWWAFLFSGIWALYHRMWMPALIILVVNMLIVTVANESLVSANGAALLQLVFQVVIGYHANDWLRAKLLRRGFVLTDVTAADSLLRAEQRYFERTLAPSH